MTEGGGISSLPREARPYQGRRAGLVTRMVAGVIDGIVVLLVLVGGYAATSVLLFLLDPRGFSFLDVSLLFSLASSFVVLVVYQTLAWWLAGRTYGGLVMGLRVVNFRGRRLRFAGSFLRAVFTASFPIGVLWVAVSRENRSVQDVVLRTSVIYDCSRRADRRHHRLRAATPQRKPLHQARESGAVDVRRHHLPARGSVRDRTALQHRRAGAIWLCPRGTMEPWSTRRHPAPTSRRRCSTPRWSGRSSRC